MSRWQLALATALNVRPGEGDALSLLFLRAFLAGLCFVFFETAASVLFLSEFDAQSLPYVYIATAAVGTAIGLLYVRVQRLLTPAQLLRGTLAFSCASVVVFAAAYYAISTRWLAAGLMVWKEVLWMLLSLEFWGMAGCLFNVRQGKRLFPVAFSGTLLAGFAGGLSVAGLVEVASTGGLLVAAAAAAALTMATGFRLTRQFAERLAVPDEDPDDPDAGVSLVAMLRRPYLRLLVGITSVSLFIFFALDYAFYGTVDAQRPDKAQLATFFGHFYAIMNLLNLVVSGLLSGRLITRFGVAFVLCALPVFLLLGSAASSTAALLGLPSMIFFWLLVGTKLADSVLREAFEEPGLRILYQPLPTRERLGVQAKLESVIGPLAGGLCGLALLGLTSLWNLEPLHLLGLVMGTCGLWIFLARRIGVSYTAALAAALSKRRLGNAAILPSDATSRAVLERGLASDQPAEAIYCFQLLEEMNHPKLDAFLLDGVEHADGEVRSYTLERIESRNVREAAPLLLGRLAAETEPKVRGRLLSTLCAVAEGELPAPVLSGLYDPEPEVRRGAIVGLLRNGGIDGIVEAGAELKRYLTSSDPIDRCYAAEVLGEAQLQSFYRPLVALIADSDPNVRRAAVLGVGKLGNPRLLPLIVPLLADANVRGAAAAVLADFKEAALPELQKALVEPERDSRTTRRLIRVVSQIGTSKAFDLLCNQLQHPSWVVRSATYEALSRCRFHARGEEVKKIEQSLLREIERATWCWGAVTDLSAGDDFELLRQALRSDIQQCENNVLDLLSCLYPSASVAAARHGLRSESSDVRAQGLEVLDTLVKPRINKLVIGLLDDSDSTRRVTLLNQHFPQAAEAPDQRLARILDPHSPVGLWTRLCTIYVVGQAELRNLSLELGPYLEHPLEVLRESALWSRARCG